MTSSFNSDTIGVGSSDSLTSPSSSAASPSHSPSPSASPIGGPRRYPAWLAFPMSTLCGVIGWSCVHPLDLIKVRMNLSNDPTVTMRGTIREVLRGPKGVLGFWEGLSAGVSRQVTYATLRLSLFDVFRDNLLVFKGRVYARYPSLSSSSSRNNSNAIGGTTGSSLSSSPAPPVAVVVPTTATLLDRAFCGAASGGTASFVSAPIELCMVRMVGDKRLAPEKQRHYRHVLDAMVRIFREEGPRTYWRGCYPAVFRASLVGCFQVGGYDHAKEVLRQSGLVPNPVVRIMIANLFIGFVYSSITMPFETVKNAMMVQHEIPSSSSSPSAAPAMGAAAAAGRKDGGGGKLLYTTISGTMRHIVATKGVKSLWRGYVPYYTRCATFMAIAFNMLEAMKAAANVYYS